MLKVAHRGASGEAPENSLAAFRLALKQKADGIEFDVRQCASGELVVIHDSTLARTVEGHGRVSALTLTELRRFKLRGGGHIPTLAETLESIGKNTYCFIELKTPQAAEAVANVIRSFVKRGWKNEKLILITFKHAALKAAKRAYPALTIGASFAKLTSRSCGIALKLGATYVTPHHESLTPTLLSQLHEAGLKVVTWTVNDRQKATRLRAMGVDGIMGDYPTRL